MGTVQAATILIVQALFLSIKHVLGEPIGHVSTLGGQQYEIPTTIWKANIIQNSFTI